MALGHDPVVYGGLGAQGRAEPGGLPVIAPVIELSELEGSSWVAPPECATCFEMVDRARGLAVFRPRIVAESMDFAVQLGARRRRRRRRHRAGP